MRWCLWHRGTEAQRHKGKKGKAREVATDKPRRTQTKPMATELHRKDTDGGRGEDALVHYVEICVLGVSGSVPTSFPQGRPRCVRVEVGGALVLGIE